MAGGYAIGSATAVEQEHSMDCAFDDGCILAVANRQTTVPRGSIPMNTRDADVLQQLLTDPKT
jgi:hypothetical protein